MSLRTVSFACLLAASALLGCPSSSVPSPADASASTDASSGPDAGHSDGGPADAGRSPPSGEVLAVGPGFLSGVASPLDDGGSAHVRVERDGGLVFEGLAAQYHFAACARFSRCEAGFTVSLDGEPSGRHAYRLFRVAEGERTELSGSPVEVALTDRFEPDEARLLAYDFPDAGLSAELSELLKRHLNVDAETGVGFPVCAADGQAPLALASHWGNVPGSLAQGLYWTHPDALLMAHVEPRALGRRRAQCGALPDTRFGILHEGELWPVDRFGFAWWDRYQTLGPQQGPWDTGGAQGVSFPHYAQFAHCVGWEFNRGDGNANNDGCATDLGLPAEGWAATGGALGVSLGLLRVTGGAGGAVLESPAFSLEASQAPFLELALGASSPQDLEGLTVAFGGSSSGEVDLGHATVPPARFAATYAAGQYRLFFPMYLDPRWTGTVQKLWLRLPRLAATRAVELNYVRPSFDTRWPLGNALFLLAAEQALSGQPDGSALLAKNLPRLRRLAAFLLTHLVTPSGVELSFFRGFDGRGDVVGGGLGGSYFDMYPVGRVDLPTLSITAAGLDAMARLEEWAAREGLLPTSATIDGADGQPLSVETSPVRLRAAAATVRAQLEQLWMPATQRYAFNLDAQGVRHDLGYLHQNLEAVALGQVPAARADAILDWVSGKRTVASDTSSGPDVFFYRFAPRARTVHDLSQFTWVLTRAIAQTPTHRLWRFGNQQLNGGTSGLTGFYELWALGQRGRTDEAWARTLELARWYRDVRAAGGRGRAFYRAYYDEKPDIAPTGPNPVRGFLQGCAYQAPYPGAPAGTFGAIGLDCEYIADAGVLALGPLQAFLGATPLDSARLRISPRVPPGLDWVGARNLWHGGNRLFVRAYASGTVDLTSSVVQKDGARLVLRRARGGTLVREDGTRYTFQQTPNGYEVELPVVRALFRPVP